MYRNCDHCCKMPKESRGLVTLMAFSDNGDGCYVGVGTLNNDVHTSSCTVSHLYCKKKICTVTLITLIHYCNNSVFSAGENYFHFCSNLTGSVTIKTLMKLQCLEFGIPQCG